MSHPTYSYNEDRQRKLTHEQVREAVERYSAGERVQDIAASLGVTPQAISYHAAKHTVLWRDRHNQSAATARAIT